MFPFMSKQSAEFVFYHLQKGLEDGVRLRCSQRNGRRGEHFRDGAEFSMTGQELSEG